MKCLFLFPVFLTPELSFTEQSVYTVKEIVKRNIRTIGEKSGLKNVDNFIFKTGLTTYYLSSSGQMKIVVRKEASIKLGGSKLSMKKDPIISEVILVGENLVKKNSFNKITEIYGLQRFVYQCLAKLQSGFFSLMKFENQLELQGIKVFGSKKYIKPSTMFQELEVDFYLDEKGFSLKRIILKGFDQEKGKCELNHDFGPLQEIKDFNIPSFWFSSEVGKRGDLYEISDVMLNQSIPEDFFHKLC